MTLEDHGAPWAMNTRYSTQGLNRKDGWTRPNSALWGFPALSFANLGKMRGTLCNPYLVIHEQRALTGAVQNSQLETLNDEKTALKQGKTLSAFYAPFTGCSYALPGPPFRQRLAEQSPGGEDRHTGPGPDTKGLTATVTIFESLEDFLSLQQAETEQIILRK